MTPDLFQSFLLKWFQKNGRKHLPWQNPRTPYRVWLSEVMLQQTQVATVIPYFNEFIKHFPDIKALATASLDQVLQKWAGLGYYARARNLHKASQTIMAEHQGQVPNTVEALESLPGIGRSTAGAIISLAFNQPAAILDGNVKRVLCRIHGISGWPGSPAVMQILWELTETYISKSAPADYTQAIMDFGSLLCTRTQPKCDQCPVQSGCIAYQQQKVDQYPTPKPLQTLTRQSMQALVLVNEEQNIFLEKRPPVGIWGGLWSLPHCPADHDIQTWCHENYQCTTQKTIQYPIIKHSFTHFHLDITPVICHVQLDNPNVIQDYSTRGWFTQRAVLQEKGLAAPIKKLLHSLELLHLNN